MNIKTSETRKKIDEFCDAYDFDSIGKLPRFSVFEKRDWKEDTRLRHGCLTWLFQGDTDLIRNFARNPLSPAGYHEVTDPQPGDIVTYFFHSPMKGVHPEPIPTHSGMYLGDGRVRSKFRESHVYEHPLSCVPTGYGTEVRFFRKYRVSKHYKRTNSGIEVATFYK